MDREDTNCVLSCDIRPESVLEIARILASLDCYLPMYCPNIRLVDDGFCESVSGSERWLVGIWYRTQIGYKCLVATIAMIIAFISRLLYHHDATCAKSAYGPSIGNFHRVLQRRLAAILDSKRVFEGQKQIFIPLKCTLDRT